MKLHISLSQTFKQAKNRGVAETKIERCLVLFAIEERERESCTNKKLQEGTSSEKQRLKEEISRHPPCFARLSHYPHRENSLISNTLMLMGRPTSTPHERDGYHSHIIRSLDIKYAFHFVSYSHSEIPGFPFLLFCSPEQNSRNIFRNITNERILRKLLLTYRVNCSVAAVLRSTTRCTVLCM